MAGRQTCAKCSKKIEGEYRMALMIGPLGYRRYAVHADCTSVAAGREGGRQRAKRKMQKAEGGGMKAEGGAG